MTYNKGLVFYDCQILIPPYKGYTEDEIKIIEFFMSRRTKNLDTIEFKWEEHKPISLPEIEKVIKRFHSKK